MIERRSDWSASFFTNRHQLPTLHDTAMKWDGKPLQQPAEQPCQEGGGPRRRGPPETVVLREMGVGIGRGGRRIADDTAISKYF